MFSIQQQWFDERMRAFLITGHFGADPARFAIARDAVHRFGWNACMVEAFRRLEVGERDFGIAPAPGALRPVVRRPALFDAAPVPPIGSWEPQSQPT